ncbi:fasciclin-like arabinogalactan protein 1 [Phtheirospermum japonicum]|uniref:Fasciclin-like arabinogalactan protein 1 n=1 Tax=Phtheirospermum japonicum TaxID=374723 RepID=A0A830CQ42_9LAMI|nr:fasciclin-like arabinogalactan protein 1 [Phtheirospermum japonicum]
MQLRQAAAAALLTLSLSLFLLPTPTHAGPHNITHILEGSGFSTFNDYLTKTQLALEINHGQTITVCAVDNAAMNDLLSKNLDTGAVRNVLSLHVLLDYYDAKKLQQITNGTARSATLFQTTGRAAGSTGFVNITNLSGGKVVFWPQGDEAVNATFVKEVFQNPYNISVIQISKVLLSPEAEAPAPAPVQVNLTAAMSVDHGCKVFADTLAANKLAQQTFDDNVRSGLTILCPGDAAMNGFLPRYKNLTAEGKQNLLEYHGVPVYQSFQNLKSNNGGMYTLATDGGKSNYAFTVQNDGDDVTIKNKIVTAKIVSTLTDSPPQFAIYQLDKVLLPEELFKSALAPTPAPAPGPEAAAGSPRPSRHRSPPAPPPADVPVSSADAPGPDGEVADQNGADRFKGGVILTLCLCFVFLQL